MDDIEAAMLRAAARALRRRADRQLKIAADWTTAGERGAIVCSGEATIAIRLASALGDLAGQFEEAAR